MKIKQKIKPLIVALVLSLNTVSANADIEKKMDAMWQTTSASFHSKGVNGAYTASLGGFSTRAPIRNINIFSWSPPKFKAGCGGIDAQFGSFSLISKDQIEQVVKAVMNNMKGYAIKLAINKICPDCLGVLNNLEATATGLSSSMKNTCEISAAGVDWLATAVGLNETTTQNDSVEDYGDAKKQQADKDGNKLRGTPGNTAHDWAQYGNSLLNMLISAQVFEKNPVEDGKYDIGIYGSHEQFFQVAMSLFGTTIVRTNEKEYDDEEIPPIWSLHDFINGERPNHKLVILTCANGSFSTTDVEACQKVETKEVEYKKGSPEWRGAYRYSLELLLGKQDDTDYRQGIYTIKPNSLVHKLRQNQNGSNLKLEAREYDFWVNSQLLMPQTKSAFAALITRQGDEIVLPIAELLAKEVANQMAAELAGSMVQTVRTAYSSHLPNNKRRAILSPAQQKVLDDIEKQVHSIEDNKVKENNNLTQMMNIINNMTRQGNNQLAA